MTSFIGKNDYWTALKTSIDTSNCEMKSIVTYSNGMLKCIVQLNNINVTEIYGNPANNVNPFNIVPESFKSTCNYLQKLGRQLANGCKNPMTNEHQFPVEYNALDKENETPPKLKKNADNGEPKTGISLKKEKSAEKGIINSSGKNNSKLKMKKEVNFNYAKVPDSKYELTNFPSKNVKKIRNKNENLSEIALVQEQLKRLHIMKRRLKQDNCKDQLLSDDSDSEESKTILVSADINISESTSSNDKSTGKPKRQENKLNDSENDKKQQNVLPNKFSDPISISDESSSESEDTDFSGSSSEITEDIDEINDVSLESPPIQFAASQKSLPNKKPTEMSITVRRLDLLRNTITKNQNKAVESSISIHHNFEHKKLDESNVGFQMMKTIGWTGDALGKNSTGITEPIGFTINDGRSGFGASTSILAPKPTESSMTNQSTAAASPSALSSKKNKSKKSRDKDKMKSISKKIIRNFLLAYAEDSKQTNNLVISSGFTKKEIKSLKRAAKGYGLECIGRTDDYSKRFSLIIAKPADYTIDLMEKHKQKDSNKRNRRARRRNIQNLWALKAGQSN